MDILVDIIKTLDTKVASLRDKKKSLEQQNVELNLENERLQNELNTLPYDIKCLPSQLSEYKIFLESSAQEIETLNVVASEKKTDILKLIENNELEEEAWKNEISNHRQNLESLINRCRESIEGQDKELLESRRVVLSQGERDRLKQEIESLRKRLEVDKQQFSKLEESLVTKAKESEFLN